jgi:hypothetical protein
MFISKGNSMAIVLDIALRKDRGDFPYSQI